MSPSVDTNTINSGEFSSRLTEPPEIWLSRIFAALVLHAMLLFGLRVAWSQIMIQKGGTEGAIDYIEVSTGDMAPPAAAPQITTSAQSPPQSATSPVPPPPQSLTPESTEILTQVPEQTPVSSPQPTQLTVKPPQSASSPQPQVPIRSTPQPDVLPSPHSSPSMPASIATPAPRTSASSQPVSTPIPTLLPSASTTPITPPPSPSPQATGPAESGQVLPPVPQPKDDITPGDSGNTANSGNQSTGEVGVLPGLEGAELTPDSIREIGGAADLNVVNEPRPGLKFRLSVPIGETLIVRLQMAVDQETQRTLMDDRNRPVFRVLPDSPALIAKQIDRAALEDVVAQILTEYQFEVKYRDIDAVKPAAVTQWDIKLSIKVL